MIALTGSTNNSFNYVIRPVKRSTQNNTDDASVTEELNSVGTASTTEHQIFCQRRLKEGTEGKTLQESVTQSSYTVSFALAVAS